MKSFKDYINESKSIKINSVTKEAGGGVTKTVFTKTHKYTSEDIEEFITNFDKYIGGVDELPKWIQMVFMMNNFKKKSNASTLKVLNDINSGKIKELSIVHVDRGMSDDRYEFEEIDFRKYK